MPSSASCFLGCAKPAADGLPAEGTEERLAAARCFSRASLLGLRRRGRNAKYTRVCQVHTCVERGQAGKARGACRRPQVGRGHTTGLADNEPVIGAQVPRSGALQSPLRSFWHPTAIVSIQVMMHCASCSEVRPISPRRPPPVKTLKETTRQRLAGMLQIFHAPEHAPCAPSPRPGRLERSLTPRAALGAGGRRGCVVLVHSAARHGERPAQRWVGLATAQAAAGRAPAQARGRRRSIARRDCGLGAPRAARTVRGGSYRFCCVSLMISRVCLS